MLSDWNQGFSDEKGIIYNRNDVMEMFWLSTGKRTWTNVVSGDVLKEILVIDSAELRLNSVFESSSKRVLHIDVKNCICYGNINQSPEMILFGVSHF